MNGADLVAPEDDIIRNIDDESGKNLHSFSSITFLLFLFIKIVEESVASEHLKKIEVENEAEALIEPLSEPISPLPVIKSLRVHQNEVLYIF